MSTQILVVENAVYLVAEWKIDESLRMYQIYQRSSHQHFMPYSSHNLYNTSNLNTLHDQKMKIKMCKCYSICKVQGCDRKKYSHKFSDASKFSTP